MPARAPGSPRQVGAALKMRKRRVRLPPSVKSSDIRHAESTIAMRSGWLALLLAAAVVHCAPVLSPDRIVPETAQTSVETSSDPSQCFLAVSRHHIEPETTEHGVGAAGGETEAVLKTLHTSPPMACDKTCTVDEGTLALSEVHGFSNGGSELPPATYVCIGQMPAAGE